MVEGLGIVNKRPFCWLLTFSVDGQAYAVGTIYFDNTNTRKKEWYGKYYMGLYKVRELFFINEHTVKKELDDITLENPKAPIRDTFFDFKKTFSEEALEHDDELNMTSNAKRQYDLEENTIIFNRLLAPVFPQKYYKELFAVLFETA